MPGRMLNGMSTPQPDEASRARERRQREQAGRAQREQEGRAPREHERRGRSRGGGPDRARPRGRSTAGAQRRPRRAIPVPELRYPEHLPVVERKDDIAAAIRDHQVVIVAGETGSGKTTQLPKICLELGRGIEGLIGHTQPRRIAARSVAERIAEELERRARRGRRLPGALHRPVERRHPRQGDDRRHPARRDAARPGAAQVRHDHHRRGPRAQPQHRLHPRLPQAAAAAPPRPQGHHHLGDDRPRSASPSTSPGPTARPRRSSRSPAAPTPSRSATGRWSTPRTEAEERDQVTGVVRGRRGALDREPGRATSWCSSPASARSATPPTRSARWACPQTRDPAALRAALGGRAAPGLRPAQRAPDRARDQRRRDVADRARHPLRRRHRHRPDLPLQPAHQGAAAADRADLAGQRQPARRPLRPRRRRHLHPALLRGGLRRPAGVHRAGDPAHQPRVRHPADDRARARRHRARSRSSTPPDSRQIADGVRLLEELQAFATGSGGEAPPPPDAGAERDASSRHTGSRLPAAARPAARPDAPRGRPQRLRSARCS